MSNFGKQIKLLREKLNLTQDKISDILEVSQSYYSKLEKQEHEPTSDIIIKASNYFNVSTDWLLKNEETKEIPDLIKNYNLNPLIFSKNLNCIIKKNITQKNLANNIGVSKTAINNYCNGRIPDTTTLYRLSQALNVSIEKLLTGKDTLQLMFPTDLTNDEVREVQSYVKYLIFKRDNNI